MKKIKISSIKYFNYKVFKEYRVNLTDFNILVGANNAGKSTIIGSLKILAIGIKKVKARKPERLPGIDGRKILGWEINLDQTPESSRNVYHNLDVLQVPQIRFHLSDKSYFELYFTDQSTGILTHHSDEYLISKPSEFKKHLNLDIGFVPDLGPVEREEHLRTPDTARLALSSSTSARNFRNIWHHFPESFVHFQELVMSTWPEMQIDKPWVDRDKFPPHLIMPCYEDENHNNPREISWAGSGFQVWCQMLTFIVKNDNATIFLVDEPDIFLHPELQRQLVSILRKLGPQIILATHSTEIVAEVETNEILSIDKNEKRSHRLKNRDELNEVFLDLGSNLSPFLTKLAKSKKVLFLEGNDFWFIGKFAKQIEDQYFVNRSGFEVYPVNGYSPTRIKDLKRGIQDAIGSPIRSFVVFDRDYRCKEEVEETYSMLLENNNFVHIHSRKEIENYLLEPACLYSAIMGRNRQLPTPLSLGIEELEAVLMEVSNTFYSDVISQMQSSALRYIKVTTPKIDESTIVKQILDGIHQKWDDLHFRFEVISGKQFISSLSNILQTRYRISISPTIIIPHLNSENMSQNMKELIKKLGEFSKRR